jgi:hypothetical protein
VNLGGGWHKDTNQSSCSKLIHEVGGEREGEGQSGRRERKRKRKK